MTNVLLRYKTNEGIIQEEKMSKAHAGYLAHSNVAFKKIWVWSIVFALNKKGEVDGIYHEFGDKKQLDAELKEVNN